MRSLPYVLFLSACRPDGPTVAPPPSATGGAPSTADPAIATPPSSDVAMPTRDPEDPTTAVSLADLGVYAEASFPEPDGSRPATLTILDPDKHRWLELPSSFDNCDDVDAQLAEIPGLEDHGVATAQLICDTGADYATRASLTTLVRLRPATRRAEVLWEGEGSSINTMDACLEIDVYAFVASGADAVQVVRVTEVVRTADDPHTPCQEEPPARTPITVVPLRASSG